LIPGGRRPLNHRDNHAQYGNKAMKRARLMAAFAFRWQPAQLPLRLRE